MTTREERASSYLATRFTPDPRRDDIWRHIVAFLSRWWDPGAAVADIGAGYCSFINAVTAARRVAVDVHDQLPSFAAPGVECIQASADDLRPLDDGAFDVVFASNLLEHLTRADIERALREFHRVLRPEGRLILIQPNFRLCANAYFDDYTHITPLSDRSLGDWLAIAGFQALEMQPRFLPLTLRSRSARLSFLLPVYLRLPWRPRARQMLVVAQPARRE